MFCSLKAFNARHELLLNTVPTEQERNDQSQFYSDFKERHPNLFSVPDPLVPQNHTSDSSSSLNVSDDARLSEVMVEPLTAVKEEMARLNKSKHGESMDGEGNTVQRETASRSDRAITEDDLVKPSGQTSTRDAMEQIDSKKNASTKTEGRKQKSHKKRQSVKEPSKKKAKKQKESKEKNNKTKSAPTATHPVIDKITDQTSPDPVPHGCGNDKVRPTCHKKLSGPDLDGPAVKAYKKLLREQRANANADDTNRHAPELTIDCPSCEVFYLDGADMFDNLEAPPTNEAKDKLDKSPDGQSKQQSGKGKGPDNGKKHSERNEKVREKAAVSSGKQSEIPGKKGQSDKAHASASGKPRIRLSLVKLNETYANSPKSIRIEVANSFGEFPEDGDDPSEFDDTEIDDLPVPLLHPSRPPDDEYGNPGKLKVPPVQYRLFQNEREMEIFKTLIKQGGKVEVIEEGFEKEEEVDRIDGKRVIERTPERAVTEDGTVYENKYAPRLTLNPEMSFHCPNGRGLQCTTPLDGEETEHEMRIRIQQVQYNIDKVLEKPVQYGMRLGPDHHVYSLTYVNAAENRYRLPRRRSLEEMRKVWEPDYSARPQLPTTYAAQRHFNESREAARERRGHSQDRVERISTHTNSPKTRQFDRETLVPVYKRDDPPLPVPSELDDCLEYFEHTPTFDDYPSLYLGPEERGAKYEHFQVCFRLRDDLFFLAFITC